MDQNQEMTNSQLPLANIPYMARYAYALQQSQQSNQPPQLAIAAPSANGFSNPSCGQNPAPSEANDVAVEISRHYQSATLALPPLAAPPLPASTISVLTLEAALGFPESEKDVNKMLIQSIRLSEADKARVGRVVAELNTCLTRHSESVSVEKVVKSGSLAKGTATSGGGLDVDLVVFAKGLMLGGDGSGGRGSGGSGGRGSGGSGDGRVEMPVGEQTAEAGVEAGGVIAAVASTSFIDLTSSKEIFRRFRELFMKQLMWDFQECVKCDRSHRRECFFKPPFSFFTTIDGIPVDVLGAFDLVNSCRRQGVDENVDGASSASSVDWDKLLPSLHGSEFNTSLVELQKRFVKSKIGDSDRVKDLILLVKFWFKKVVVPQASSNCRVPSFFFELVAIHHWETKLKRKSGFKLLPALKGVLLALTKPEVMNIVWTEHYSKEHVDRSLLVDFPLVLDPANPTNNVAKFAAPHIWHQLKAAAREALEETIMKR